MHDTLSSLIERALNGNKRPLEFYLRDQSRLPGPRANLELANDVSHLLAAFVHRYTESVHSLLHYFASGQSVAGNTPAEFVLFCGIVSFGACAVEQPGWHEETLQLLDHYANSPSWRIREAVATAYQRMLNNGSQISSTLTHLKELAAHGNFLQQRAAIAAIAEPALLNHPDIIAASLLLQRIVLERFHQVPALERRNEHFRALRRALGYTLSVVTAAAPEEGFALMYESASWGDSDVIGILRENLKKKRLAKFTDHTIRLASLLP